MGEKPEAPAKNPSHAPGVNPQGLKDLWKYNLGKHELTPEGERKLNAVRSAAQAMAECLIEITPPGRDQAMALSATEDLLDHARNAIERQYNTANLPPDSPPEEDKHLEQNPTTEDTSEKES